MNLVICPRCENTMIIEEYRNHNCGVGIKGVRTIAIREYCGLVIDRNGDEVQMAEGENGLFYRFVRCTHPIPHNLPHQPKGNTDNNYRQGNRTSFMVLLR